MKKLLLILMLVVLGLAACETPEWMNFWEKEEVELLEDDVVAEEVVTELEEEIAEEAEVAEEEEEVVAEEEVVEEPAEPVETDDVYAQGGLFDDCPRITGYLHKDFFDKMASDLGIDSRISYRNGDTYYFFKGSGPVEGSWNRDPYSEHLDIHDACYSEKLSRLIILAATSYELSGATFVVVDYKTDTGNFSVTEWPEGDVLPFPRDFGVRKGDRIRLNASHCSGEGDMLVNCAPGKGIKVIYEYSLSGEGIFEIYNERPW
jgi:hypothetical protein